MNSKKNSDRRVETGLNKLIQKGVLGGVFPCAGVGVSVGAGKEKIVAVR